MIVKGGARGGPTSLSNHLQKDSNERVSVVSIDGLAATDIHGALREIMALTTGTRCRDGMYHASISASPGEAEMTAEQRARAVEVVTDQLGLSGQPRIVVEHEKTGESGIRRVHQHIVFSRVDEDGKTISDFQNYPAHERAARQIERELDHERTPGAFDREDGKARPTRTPGHDEYQQGERSGLNPKEAQAKLSELWRQSDSGRAFVDAAKEEGFTICRGDRCLLVVDRAGEHVRLSRRLPDRAADIAERLSEVRDFLPTLEEARAAREWANPRQSAPQIAVEGAEALSGPDVAANGRDALSAPLEASGGPAVEPAEIDSYDITPTVADPGIRFISDDRDAAWPEGYGHASQQDGSPFDRSGRGNGGDAFADEKPRPTGPAADPLDTMSKGLGIAAGVATRVAGEALEVAGDIGEGLLGLLVGVGGSTSPAPKQAEPKMEPSMSQTQAPSRPTPTNQFSEYARARLTGEEMTEVNRQAAERANNKDRDFER